MRQAAGVLQLRNRFQRVARGRLRHVAAVEQLQKLDDELDVANAALPRLHVKGVFPLRVGAVLDAAFERLDAGDIGQGQVAAIDPRLEIGEELLPQVEVAGHGAAL